MFAPGSPEPKNPEEQQIHRAPGLHPAPAFIQTHTEPFSYSYLWDYYYYYYIVIIIFLLQAFFS